MGFGTGAQQRLRDAVEVDQLCFATSPGLRLRASLQPRRHIPAPMDQDRCDATRHQGRDLL